MTSDSQIIVYSPDVNLTERKSALNNSIQEVVTVGDLRGYKVYTALLTQSGEDPPVATVLENTIGDIVWGYYGVGVYSAVLVDAFSVDKTMALINGSSGGDGWVFFTDESQLPDSLLLVQYDSLGVSVDNCICQIEIRVYN